MSIANSSRSFVKIVLSMLLIAHSYHLSAAVMSYGSCITDKNNSYSVGGWCFYIYRNSSWANGDPPQSATQTMCLPNGNLAVGVTFKMLNVFLNHSNIGGAGLRAWVALIKYGTTSTEGWHWTTLLPNGRYANFSAIFSNIPWAANQPDSGSSSPQSALIDQITTKGIDDVADRPTSFHYKMAIICQFAAGQWSYSRKGHGRFTTSDFLIAQISATRLHCVHQCHEHPGCISLAYNPTTNDCQLYSASPEDPRFAGNVTADSTYDWQIRDGMEY